MNGWLIDLGNSRLKCAALGAGGVGAVVATAHDGHDFAPGWQAALPSGRAQAWLASVAPAPLRARLEEALVSRGVRVRVAKSAAKFCGIDLADTDPVGFGIDRLLALVGARVRDAGPMLVVGVGTALTIDLQADGRHGGGRIAPSPALMRAALHQRATQLPAEGGAYTEFATATRSALASGCLGAALALIERSLQQGSQRFGAKPGLWLHGGGAAELLPLLPAARHAPDLVLEGLAVWATRAAPAPLESAP